MSAEEQVFLSYAREDLETVQNLYADLKKRDVKVWFDKEHLKPGRWKPQIIKAIAKSNHFLICVSEAILRKTGDEPGFTDEELNTAYEIAKAQSDQTFTIIPIRIEDCDRGDHRLSSFQQFDLYKDWEGVLDRLAVQFGGRSLADSEAVDERSEDEKVAQRLRDKSMTFYYAGDYTQALTAFEKASLIQPDNVSVWVNKGSTLAQLRRYEEALATYEKVLSIQPDNLVALTNKGVVLERLGRYEEALATYEKVLSIQPDKLSALRYKGYHEDSCVNER